MGEKRSFVHDLEEWAGWESELMLVVRGEEREKESEMEGEKSHIFVVANRSTSQSAVARRAVLHSHCA